MTGMGLEEFLDSEHGFDCIVCHGGHTGIHSKENAHAGMTADPSYGDVNSCARCHDVISHRFATSSLHSTMQGYHTMFEQRTGQSINSQAGVRAKFETQCNKCHATCGECHISRPKSVGGGFIQSHLIRKTPDMSNQCTACHGSRVGDEYQGKNEGYRADVHYVPNAMRCTSCHDADEMHGDGTSYPFRYAVRNGASCRDCHEVTANQNEYHAAHGASFACQVCHSQDYKNCNDCHAGTGISQPSWMHFKIGRNPLPDNREGEIVVLRHVPISENTYTPWGVETVNFPSLPTFKYATPHNILRWTDRTEVQDGQSCGMSCHNTPNTTDGWFLRQSDLDALSDPRERQANQSLILPDVPPPWSSQN